MDRVTIDLFAGAGGLSTGFKQAGFNVVVANEYDPAIAAAYVKNHQKTHMLVNDIRNLHIEQEFDRYKNEVYAVIGGPPCQGFSLKGKRLTLNDDRNFLFKEFMRVVYLVRPQIVVMENVPSLLTAENGVFRKQIESLFRESGYAVTTGVLQAQMFGVPQNRRRAVIMASRGTRAPEMPQGNSKPVSAWEAISDLAYDDLEEYKEQSPYRTAPLTQYQAELREGSSIVTNHLPTRHSVTAIERMKLVPPGGGRANLPVEHHTKSIYSGTWGRIRKGEPAVTITTRFDTPSSGRFTHPYLNRAITVREAARLQSFPDSYTFVGTKGSQMKQVGNAVPPILARAIADSIIKQGL